MYFSHLSTHIILSLLSLSYLQGLSDSVANRGGRVGSHFYSIIGHSLLGIKFGLKSQNWSKISKVSEIEMAPHVMFKIEF